MVSKIRYKISKKIKVKKIKVGHAGTLDPLASGLLIICTGKATKKINDFQNLDKEYLATVELGRTTPSFDLETETDKTFPWQHVTKELIESKLQTMLGSSMQVPPGYSAVRFKGKRAYDYARKGEEVILEPKPIHLHQLELVEKEGQLIKLKIRCSKGTYIRSLVRDLGNKLGTGCVLTGLIRSKIGDFSVEDSISMEDFEKKLGYL